MAFRLIDRIERHAAENPMAPALVGPKGALTYAELLDSIAKVANQFADRGAPRSKRALLNIGDPHLRLVVLLAAIDYGLIPMVAQPDTLRENFKWDLVIGSPELSWREIPADLMIDPSAFGGASADGRRRSFADGDDNDISYVTETSGSTGRPKLVGVTQLQFRQALDDAWRRRTDSTGRVMTSLGSAAKYALRLATMALADGSAVVSSSRDMGLTLSLINVFNVTYFLTTPVYLDLLMDLMDTRHVRCPSVKDIQLTGATFSPDLLRRVQRHFSCRIWVGYGASEVEVGVARGSVSADSYEKGFVGEVNPELKMIATGTKASPGSIVLVHDRDLFTRSLIKEKIVQWNQPFYTLPDIGYVEGGTLFLAGRSDEVYNFSGNIKAYSAIGDELARLVRVKDVAVANGSALGHELDLVIGIVADAPIDVDGLAAQVTQRLQMPRAKPHFKIVQLAEIKRDQQTGKVDRAALIRDYQALNGVGRETWATGSIAENSRARG